MDRQYVLSERAHLMCPNMHFGILLEVACAYDGEKIKFSLDALSLAHPFLRAVIDTEAETGKLFYRPGDASRVLLTQLESERALWEAYDRLSVEKWDIFNDGLLHVFACGKETTRVLFCAHHLLCDGRGLLELAKEFADCYAGGVSPAPAWERLIQSSSELPSGSALPAVSRLLINYANHQWQKENHSVAYADYLNFACAYGASHPVKHETRTVEKERLTQLLSACREKGVSLNDYLLARIFAQTHAKKIVIAADLRERLPFYRPGALGNYSTAFGITLKRLPEDVFEAARQARAAVQAHLNNNQKLMLVLSCYFFMEPALLDAAAISALGGFDSKAGKFVGGGMFGMEKPAGQSLTNLGAFENPNLLSALFILPASPSAKRTVGALTLNGVLRLCTSEYDG